MRIELSKPVNYKDTEIYALDLDLENLTGNDLITAEENFKKTYPNGQIWGTAYAAHIAGKSAHVPAQVIMSLAINDFFKIVNAVWDFFGSANSQASKPEITDD